MQIWDTAGQERFRTITSAYYRGADGIILVFDISEKKSFYSLDNWLKEVDSLTTDNPVKLVLANKSDSNDKQVSKSEMEEFTQRTGLEIIDCSAKNSYHINYVFEYISSLLLKRL